MDKELLKTQEVFDLMNQPGWKHVEAWYEEKLKSLDTIFGVKTIKELEGKRWAINKLEEFWGELVSARGTAEDILSRKNKEDGVIKFRE